MRENFVLFTDRSIFYKELMLPWRLFSSTYSFLALFVGDKKEKKNKKQNEDKSNESMDF